MKSVSFNRPFITGHELEYLSQVVSSSRFSGPGAFSEKCEQRISEVTNSESRVTLTDSCTSALELSAMLIRRITQRQEVLLPSYTFSSTANAFLRAGFDLVFCDVSPETMMIDPLDVSKKIGGNTAAVVGVHYGGHICEVGALSSLCESFGAFFVEDAAQAFGSFLSNRSAGTFGDFGCFSFHETKNLHCGLGGALLIKDPEHYKIVRRMAERGTNRQELLRGEVDKYTWCELGTSSYPSELQAAFLLAQLNSYHENLATRRAIWLAYLSEMNKYSCSELHWITEISGQTHNGHAFWILFNSAELAERVRIGMLKDGSSPYIGYVPLHTSPMGLSLNNREGTLPVTEMLAPRLLRLPLHCQMGEQDVVKVVNNLRSHLGGGN